MKLLRFSTDAVPPAERLAQMRAGAPDFRIDAVGDPLAVLSRWELLRLGEVALLRTHTSPLRYCRDAGMIDPAADARITLHYRLSGRTSGTLAGAPVSIEPGTAYVWDLGTPGDVHTETGGDLLILNLPRHFLAQVLPCPVYTAVLSPSFALARAMDQAIFLLDHADDLLEAAALPLGRALRSMVAAALRPVLAAGPAGLGGGARDRVVAAIDAGPAEPWDAERLAAATGLAPAEVARAVETPGGLTALVERRRLLFAYRLIGDPTEGATIARLAAASGFADAAHFSRRFRAMFGISPREARARGHGDLPRWAGAYASERFYAALSLDG